MLRTFRLIAAVVCFVLITLLFLDFTGTLHPWLGWLAKVQLLPAILAMNVGVVLFLVLLTLLAGRIYCSVICPLGVFQDVVSWIAGKRKKRRFSYSPAMNRLRYGVLILFIVALVAGVGSLVALLDPYSAFGRIASNLLNPAYLWVNNLLADAAERMESYAFYHTNIWIRSLSVLITAAVTLVVVSVLAWRNGRTYCNTVCPVGTFLGFLSKYSYLKPIINNDKCNSCGLCSRNCKASCINTKEHSIDYSRCVTCMDCLNSCTKGAITYAHAPKATQPVVAETPATPAESSPNNRRDFLSLTALIATTSFLKAQEKKVDGGLAAIEDKKVPNRLTPIVPPGSRGLHHMAQHCTACQLCVTVCPNEILLPSQKLSNWMQPEMTYERGYCRPECTKCSEVCPTGAIDLISRADKSSTQIGHAVWIKANCVVITDEVKCGNCARHCPAGAILMVPSSKVPDSLEIPVVNTERCIGCGACENLCPARPFSAIYVEGHEMHRVI